MELNEKYAKARCKKDTQLKIKYSIITLGASLKCWKVKLGAY